MSKLQDSTGHDLQSATDAPAPDEEKPSRRRWRIALRAFILIAIAVVADVFITLAFEPYEAPTYLTWVNYRENAPEDIDNLVIGASTALEGFDPDTIDESLGTATFNQGFYGVSYKNVYRTLTTIGDEKDLDRVFVGVSYESPCSWPNIYSDAIFAQSKLYGESLPQQISDCADILFNPQYFFKPASFAFLAPWTVDNVGADPADIAGNVKKRLTLSPEELLAKIPDFSEKGYVTYSLSSTVDMNELASSLALPTGEGGEFVDANLRRISQMCEYCKERGIDIYVIMMPRPEFDVLNLGESYPEQCKRLQEVVEQSGGIYLDTNALDPEVYRAGDADFIDEQHLNHSGAVRFSGVFSDLIKKHESGENFADFCISYDNWDEYSATVDGIALVQCKDSLADGVLSLEAIPTVGAGVEPEYQFVEVLDDGTQRELRGWSDDPNFSTTLEGHGTIKVRINARTKGSDADYERYWTKNFTY